MKEENLKLLLQSYIECKQIQDECDALGNIAVESCDSSPPYSFSVDSPNLYFMQEQGGQPNPVVPQHLLPFEPAPSLSPYVISVGRSLVRMAQAFSESQPSRSIIHFEKNCAVIEPVEQTISIPIVRHKDYLQNITKASWKTCDKTAVSGKHFVESRGRITFNEGETNQDIQIQILKSDDEGDDLRFIIELHYDGELFAPEPMTISLKRIENLDSNEKTVLENLSLLQSLPFSVPDIRCALDSCLNARTFHMALTHLCSKSNTLDIQIALALELSLLCLRKSCGNSLRGDIIFKVLKDFFKKDDYNF